MPIQDCPFTECDGGVYRPILPIRIINPHSGKNFLSYGIIDTGADECAVPATFAPVLGHDLLAGIPKNVSTGNGITNAYSHTTIFEIYDPGTHEIAYTIVDTPVDFMPNLPVVLLGVRNFLSNFILRIDYPNKIFSIRYPD